MIPKTICQSAYSTDGPAAISEICRLVTRSGLSNSTLNFLRLCNIMEPMTELFTFHKVNSFRKYSAKLYIQTFRMDPRECLKNCLYQKWNKIMNPPEGQRDVRGGKTNRRKRKPSHPPRKGRQNSRWGWAIFLLHANNLFLVIFSLLVSRLLWEVWPMTMSDQ